MVICSAHFLALVRFCKPQIADLEDILPLGTALTHSRQHDITNGRAVGSPTPVVPVKNSTSKHGLIYYWIGTNHRRKPT